MFKFKECREKAGFTQKEAAQFFGVSIQTVSNWETGARCPSLEQAWHIADIYNVSLDELVGRNATNETSSPAQSLSTESTPHSSQPSPSVPFMPAIKIKELRKQRKITQAELADVLCVTNVTLSRYETGEREMPYQMLFQLADYFDVSIDTLLGRKQITKIAEISPIHETRAQMLQCILNDLIEEALKKRGI